MRHDEENRPWKWSEDSVAECVGNLMTSITEEVMESSKQSMKVHDEIFKAKASRINGVVGTGTWSDVPSSRCDSAIVF